MHPANRMAICVRNESIYIPKAKDQKCIANPKDCPNMYLPSCNDILQTPRMRMRMSMIVTMALKMACAVTFEDITNDAGQIALCSFASRVPHFAINSRCAGEEGVGLRTAELVDAVVAPHAVVGFLEEFRDVACLAQVCVCVLAGVVFSFGWTIGQGLKIDQSTDALLWFGAGDGALQGQTEPVDKTDVAVLIRSPKSALQFRVLCGGGVAGVLTFVLADEHACIGREIKALRGGLGADPGVGPPSTSVEPVEVIIAGKVDADLGT